MKTALVLALTFASLSQPKIAPKPQEAAEQPVKKLASVTWDLESHRLVWLVQKGAIVDGEFVPASQDRYEISPDEAAMSLADDSRRIDPEEAGDLRELLDTLSVYCVQSSIRWDHGKPTDEKVPQKEKDRQIDPKSLGKTVRIGM